MKRLETLIKEFGTKHLNESASLQEVMQNLSFSERLVFWLEVCEKNEFVKGFYDFVESLMNYIFESGYLNPYDLTFQYLSHYENGKEDMGIRTFITKLIEENIEDWLNRGCDKEWKDTFEYYSKNEWYWNSLCSFGIEHYIFKNCLVYKVISILRSGIKEG